MILQVKNGTLNFQLQMPNEGREALKKISADKANSMLNKVDLNDITEMQKNKITDAFIEHFSNQNNFNQIFK
jgi:hypothetical protein